MKQRTFFKVLCVVLLLTRLIPSAGLTRAREGIETPTSDDYVAGELLVKFRSSVSPTTVNGSVQTGVASLDELIEEYDVKAAEPLFTGVADSEQGLEHIYRMDLPETADVLVAAAVFGADAHVEYAEPNYTYHITGEPDAFFPRMTESTTSNASITSNSVHATSAYTSSIRTIVEEHPVIKSSATRVLDVRIEGEVVIVDLSIQVLPNGKFDPTPFSELAQALDEQMQLRQEYMLTFMVEGKTLDHWGMQVPDEVGTSVESQISVEGEGPLAGKKIALNPGHGRYYTGDAWTWQRGWHWGIIEDLVNAEIQIYVAQYLEDLGATIVYLREPDKEAGIGESGLSRWKESARHYLQFDEAPERVWNTTACGSDNLCKDIMARPYGANYYGVDLLISLHNNGGEGTGTETWYDTSGDHHSVASAYNLADSIHTNVINEIQAEYDSEWTDRGVKSSDGGYGENHYAQMPAALIEVAFMDTESPDNEALQDETFNRLTAKAIVQGVCDYYGVSCTLANDPDDPLLSYEWGLDNTGQTGGKDDADIDAPEAWEITTGVTETMIAVIDTGVDYNHEDLDDGRVRTDIDQDYVNDDDDAMDDHSHGTHVAGTIAAETNNGVGVAGVMWEAQILPLKVLNSRGSGSADDVAAAIRYAADQDADAINMSLGSPSCSQTIADAINYAYDKDVVIVAASGNNGGSISYPAKHAPVIAVGATDHNDHKAYFSNYGDELDVVAPGVSIFSTVPNNGYDAFSGTSMASPHVAGVVGLLLSQRSDLSNGQVREILRQSADDLGQGGFDTYYGYGRVNAHQALQAETPDEPPAPEDADCTSTGPCAAGVAVEGTEDGSSILSDLRAVRDEVFTEDPGQRWVDIYYEHQGEVAWLLATHKELRADALVGFRAFAPVFRAGLGEGPSVTLTPDLIEAAREALMGVAEHGSEEVHDDIVREWEKVDPYRFVGQDVLEVWEQLKREERTMTVYLPLVMK